MPVPIRHGRRSLTHTRLMPNHRRNSRKRPAGIADIPAVRRRHLGGRARESRPGWHTVMFVTRHRR